MLYFRSLPGKKISPGIGKKLKGLSVGHGDISITLIHYHEFQSLSVFYYSGLDQFNIWNVSGLMLHLLKKHRMRFKLNVHMP